MQLGRSQARADLAQMADQACRVLDGVDPIRRIGRMARCALYMAAHRKLALVPEDRKKQGVVLEMSVSENVSLASLRRDQKAGLINRRAERDLCREMIGKLRIKTPGGKQLAQFLSGGNQQKVVIAKWLAAKPKVIILDEPTKGIDIGSKAAVHEFMAELAAEGLAVIMVSSEIPEILGMSDRVIVMREGRIVAELADSAMTPENLVRAAAGIAEAA